MSHENSAVEFADQWHVVRRAVVDADAARCLHDHVMARASEPMIALGDNQIAHAPVAYGDPVTDTLLATVRPRVEQATGLRLWPTYSYFPSTGTATC